MLRLQYDTTPGEIEGAIRQHHWAKVVPPLLRLAGLILALALVLAIPPFGPLREFLSGELKTFLLVCALVGTLVLAVSALVAWWGLRRLVRPLRAPPAAHRAVRIPVTLQIDGAGISVDFIDGGQPRPWSAVTGFLETRDYAVIRFRGQDFAFVPKRHLNPAGLEDLRNLVAARLSATSS